MKPAVIRIYKCCPSGLNNLIVGVVSEGDTLDREIKTTDKVISQVRLEHYRDNVTGRMQVFIYADLPHAFGRNNNVAYAMYYNEDEGGDCTVIKYNVGGP